MVRSLESLRDLDYVSWQAVAYREGAAGGPVVLRIVGYPGKLCVLIIPLIASGAAGRRDWDLRTSPWTMQPSLRTDETLPLNLRWIPC